MNDAFFAIFHGLGDAVYALPVMRELAKHHDNLYWNTPWPQIAHADPEIKPTMPMRPAFKAQIENIEFSKHLFHERPQAVRRGYMANYTIEDLKSGRTILQSMLRHCTLDPDMPVDAKLDVPNAWREQAMSVMTADKIKFPFSIVHPPTMRKYVPVPGRNPHMKYIQGVVDATPNMNWIEVGAVDGEDEVYYEAPLKNANKLFAGGILMLEAMIGMVSMAKVVLAGPSFMAPLCQAVNTPQFVVFGGYVPPPVMFDKRMGMNYDCVVSHNACFCCDNTHDCPGKDMDMDEVVDMFKGYVGGLA